jgi:hypothetical protein
VPFDRALMLIRWRTMDEYVFRHGPSANDKTRHWRGPHEVREKERVQSSLSALAKNINYFRSSLVSAVGIEPTTL